MTQTLPTGHVFIATSLDGFIARADGDIDWLVARDDPDEDHGYEAFIAGMDGIVMGRGSFEKVLEFEAWPYDLPVTVLSRSLTGVKVPDELAAWVRFSAETPRAAMARLGSEGMKRVYVDGGQVISAFLRSGLIEDMVITQVPILLGAGRRLFGDLGTDVSLALEGIGSFPSGLLQARYRVVR